MIPAEALAADAPARRRGPASRPAVAWRSDARQPPRACADARPARVLGLEQLVMPRSPARDRCGGHAHADDRLGVAGQAPRRDGWRRASCATRGRRAARVSRSVSTARRRAGTAPTAAPTPSSGCIKADDQRGTAATRAHRTAPGCRCRRGKRAAARCRAARRCPARPAAPAARCSTAASAAGDSRRSSAPPAQASARARTVSMQ